MVQHRDNSSSEIQMGSKLLAKRFAVSNLRETESPPDHLRVLTSICWTLVVKGQRDFENVLS